MIEVSLINAINRCKQEGGTMRRVGCEPSFKYDLGLDLFRCTETDSRLYQFSIFDITATWIYEPPKESAFKKAIGQYAADVRGTPNDFRKEGWNAAIDEILSLVPYLIAPIVQKDGGTCHLSADYYSEHQIKRLKEC